VPEIATSFSRLRVNEENGVIPIANRSADAEPYVACFAVVGAAILSRVLVSQADPGSSLVVRYFDAPMKDGFAADRRVFGEHDPILATSVDSVNGFVDAQKFIDFTGVIYIECIVTGGSVEFGVQVKSSQSDFGLEDAQINAAFSPQGLQNEGRHTEVTINDSGWTALPSIPLNDRNAIAVQNFSGFEMKYNYATVGSYAGMRIIDRANRELDIKDDIILYGRAEPGAGSVVVDVEEVS